MKNWPLCFAVFLAIQALPKAEGNGGPIDWNTYEVPSEVRTKFGINSCTSDIQEQGKAFGTYERWMKEHAEHAEGCTCKEVIEIYKFAKSKNFIDADEEKSQNCIDKLYWILCGSYPTVVDFEKRDISALLTELNGVDAHAVERLADFREALGQHVGGKVQDSQWPLKVVVEEVNKEKVKMDVKIAAFVESYDKEYRGRVMDAEVVSARDNLVNLWSKQFYSLVFATIHFCTVMKLGPLFYGQIVDPTKFVSNQALLKSSLIKPFIDKAEAKTHAQKDINNFPVLLNNLSYIFVDEAFQSYQGIAKEEAAQKFVIDLFEVTSTKKPEISSELLNKVIKTFCGISLKRFRAFVDANFMETTGEEQRAKPSKGSGGGEEDDDDSQSRRASETKEANYVGFLRDLQGLTGSTADQYMEGKKNEVLLSCIIQKRDSTETDVLECQ